MRVKIDIECDASKAIAHLEAMSARSKDFTPVFREARSYLEKANAENFAANGLPVGGWDPRKKDYAWPILRKTGRLLFSLANLHGSPNTITPMYAEFGTEVKYAKFHQYGTKFMPARQVVFDPPGFSRDMASMAAKWVARGKI